MTSQNLPRSVRLRAWMKEHFIRSKDLADQLGITAQRVNVMIRAATMPSAHHAACLRLGFPEELLPTPSDGRPEPVTYPPGLQQTEGAQPKAG